MSEKLAQLEKKGGGSSGSMEWTDVSSSFPTIINQSINTINANYDFSDVTGVRLIITYSTTDSNNMSITLLSKNETIYTRSISSEYRGVQYNDSQLKYVTRGASTNRAITRKIYVSKTPRPEINAPTS